MFGFEGIHGVVIHGIDFLLAEPVEETHRQQLEHDVDKPCVVLHVHWQAVVRNLTEDPGTTTSAQINLHNEKKLNQESDHLTVEQNCLAMHHRRESVVMYSKDFWRLDSLVISS